jgi:DNA-binding MarR family transcriptional regulator
LIVTGLFFEERQMRPSELAVTFCTSRSNMSHVLRSLEKKGWIERSTSALDARAYLFGLSREGKRRAAHLIKVFDATEEYFEKALMSKKINQSLKACQKIYQALPL